jgi:hypothetical protein
MFVPFLFAASALALAVLGVLIIIQVVTLQDIIDSFLRGIFLLSAFVGVVWLLKSVLLPIVVCVLVALKQAFFWIVLAVAAVAATLFVLQLLVGRVRGWSRPNSKQQGDH